MNKFNLDEYETVEVRLERFWETYPTGRIATHLVFQDDKRFIFEATLYRDLADDLPYANGHAEEIVGATMVNKTSAAENCETSAIGRALANGGFAAKGKRPSREEMTKVASRGQFEPVQALAKIAAAQSPDELKDLWTQVPLDLSVDGSTLREHILARVEMLKENGDEQ